MKLYSQNWFFRQSSRKENCFLTKWVPFFFYINQGNVLEDCDGESVWLYSCASSSKSCPDVSGVSGGGWVWQDLSGRDLYNVHHTLADKLVLVLPLHSLLTCSALAVLVLTWLLETWRMLSISCSTVTTAALLLVRQWWRKWVCSSWGASLASFQLWRSIDC